MLKVEETANIVQLLDDLQVDLRNGNVPAAKLLIISLVGCLALKQPLEWSMLGTFISDHLEEIELRLSLLHLLPKVKELLDPFRPEQEASPEC